MKPEEKMKFNIVVTDGYTVNPGDLSWDFLNAYGNVTVYERSSGNETAERIKDADIVISNKTVIRKKELQNARNLKAVFILTTGYDAVDKDLMKEMGIKLYNVPSYGTDTVAEMTFALILECARNAGLHWQSVKEGVWQEKKEWTYTLGKQVELSGKTLGIIEYGRIGKRVSEIAMAFKMKPVILRHGISGEMDNLPVYERKEFFSSCDFITLHCPLTPETREIINEETLGMMKKDGFIINTARGALINEDDLSKALEEKRIAGAALDVSVNEPIKSDSPLLKTEGVIITPHIAWSSSDARKRIMEATEMNIEDFLSGRDRNLVNGVISNEG